MSALVSGCRAATGNAQSKMDKPVSDHYNITCLTCVNRPGVRTPRRGGPSNPATLMARVYHRSRHEHDAQKLANLGYVVFSVVAPPARRVGAAAASMQRCGGCDEERYPCLPYPRAPDGVRALPSTVRHPQNVGPAIGCEVRTLVAELRSPALRPPLQLGFGFRTQVDFQQQSH